MRNIVDNGILLSRNEEGLMSFCYILRNERIYSDVARRDISSFKWNGLASRRDVMLVRSPRVSSFIHNILITIFIGRGRKERELWAYRENLLNLREFNDKSKDKCSDH